ncbi:MAG: ABC transporter ATP-binding protein [Firmicutes bacterium HGW-Firmicutes-1]|jgi:ABC-2 type transport system ATP-binding protein|nr:MAG: ABC transporter ATP-binding protein [Firmicutes bacterium HGW-Firmicutes-1]
MALLQTNDLSKRFGKTLAVDGASITLEPGKIYGLLGPNGSGKSTLMKMIAGLFHPTNGSIEVLGSPVGVNSKKHVAYMTTEQYLYEYMTIKTVGQFHKDFYEDFEIDTYKRLIDTMKLDMRTKVSSLSSGMASKLKIAATMSRNAKLFMLDEPLNGIDLIARDQIINAMIERATPENTLLISSHLIDEMEKILDDVIFIKEGKIVVMGNAEEVREKHGKSIVDLYREVYEV